MAGKKTSFPVWLRRLSQTVFLLLFLYLFTITAYHPENATGGPVTLFFNLDPLVMFTLWLGGHAVAAALLFSFITLGVTLLFGRWFCGWVCPFGALHTLLTSWRKGKKKELVKAGSYSNLQKSKYYILVLFLFSALFGANVMGWLDPFSFFYRSLATAVYPAINAGFGGFFNWVYEVNPLNLSAVTEPLYKGLRMYLLTFEQPRFDWGMLIGVLFGVVIALNFFRGRFWCRYICPLGGLLGIFGKNPTVRVTVDADRCKNCLDCVATCQGGADPKSTESWKPAECLYCWNCRSECPEDAISINFKAPGRTS
jgi:polyferredoxin